MRLKSLGICVGRRVQLVKDGRSADRSRAGRPRRLVGPTGRRALSVAAALIDDAASPVERHAATAALARFVDRPASATGAPARATIALVGNPNAGKTSLFNQLTGLRAKTANFPGTTVEHRRGRCASAASAATLIDLPGLYSLDAVTPDERVAVDALARRLPGAPRPDAVLLVADATNLERNLFLASQVLELGPADGASRST